MNKYTIKYEFLNTTYNGYAFFFGALFPTGLLHLIVKGSLGDVPQEYKAEAVTAVFFGMALLIPLACIFLSHAASYSNELDKKVPERIMLYGFSARSILLNKMVANFIFLTACVLIYFAGTLPFLEIKAPKPAAAAVWILCIYLLSGFLMMLAHGIATLIGKFGPTYGVVMGLYFIIMILSGYMGVPVSRLPKVLRPISDLLPTTQLGNDYIDFWMGREYNFGPLVQSMLFFGALSLIVLLIAFKVRDRRGKRK